MNAESDNHKLIDSNNDVDWTRAMLKLASMLGFNRSVFDISPS
ncbi:MAG: hypothetical protein U0892_15780 [Pirellulales bacterium]